ncbi:hypothetical protein Hdeb2414_s0001g00019711 [Helianthus debilis subsp. tardiflorus]
MDDNRHSLTPQKRPNNGYIWQFNKQTPDSGGGSSRNTVSAGSRRVYKFKIRLPNGMTVSVKIPEGTESITFKDLANRVKELCHRAIQAEKTSNPKKSVKWDADLCFIDDYDRVVRNCLKLTKLEMNRVYNLRLDNMWDLTPDTKLLIEFPEEYTFEIALAYLNVTLPLVGFGGGRGGFGGDGCHSGGGGGVVVGVSWRKMELRFEMRSEKGR